MKMTPYSDQKSPSDCWNLLTNPMVEGSIPNMHLYNVCLLVGCLLA